MDKSLTQVRSGGERKGLLFPTMLVETGFLGLACPRKHWGFVYHSSQLNSHPATSPDPCSHSLVHGEPKEDKGRGWRWKAHLASCGRGKQEGGAVCLPCVPCLLEGRGLGHGSRHPLLSASHARVGAISAGLHSPTKPCCPRSLSLASPCANHDKAETHQAWAAAGTEARVFPGP